VKEVKFNFRSDYWRAQPKGEKPMHEIKKVSEMIADNFVEVMLACRQCDTPPSFGLWDMLETLHPEIKDLEDQQRKILEDHNLSQALLNRLVVDQANAAYTVGVLTGLHKAGRTDLVAKFSEIYAREK
jgi:hypothetical protein